MNWEVISAAAEVVSAAAVVISLIYLGIQIRGGNQLSRANTFHHTNAQFAALMSLVSGDAELARIYRKAKLGENLEPDDLERYKAFLWSYFAFAENLYIQQESGLYAHELGTTDITEFMAKHFKRVLASQQAREWLQEEGKELLNPAFYESVHKYIQPIS